MSNEACTPDPNERHFYEIGDPLVPLLHFSPKECDGRVDAAWGAIKTKDARIEEIEEAARWRKWPEEKPEDGQLCVVDQGGEDDPAYSLVEFSSAEIYVHWWNTYVTHWRPIDPPKEVEG